MTTKIYACVVHDKRTLSLLKVFFHRFSGGREKKRVVNVFHTNKVFRLDARPENDKTKRFLVCVKKKDAKKRERDSLFPSSSTFYGLVKSHVSDRSVSLSMDPHSRKKPLPFPPPNKKKTKKNTKNWTVLVKHHQDENVRCKRRLKTKKHFFVVFIYRKKKRKTTTDETRPIPISLSNNTNLLSKRQKNARDDIVLSSRKRKRKRHQTKCCYARKR